MAEWSEKNSTFDYARAMDSYKKANDRIGAGASLMERTKAKMQEAESSGEDYAQQPQTHERRGSHGYRRAFAGILAAACLGIVILAGAYRILTPARKDAPMENMENSIDQSKSEADSGASDSVTSELEEKGELEQDTAQDAGNVMQPRQQIEFGGKSYSLASESPEAVQEENLTRIGSLNEDMKMDSGEGTADMSVYEWDGDWILVEVDGEFWVYEPEV
ncbi:hypothetical protein [Anaerolentibacter hominis]|uniref:hypothetical protein n=1 Tax=Anaerolentibacter hominis TaxID=3079009 RepID=UPI0031B7EBC4